jgi:hypothetical protein
LGSRTIFDLQNIVSAIIAAISPCASWFSIDQHYSIFDEMCQNSREEASCSNKFTEGKVVSRKPPLRLASCRAEAAPCPPKLKHCQPRTINLRHRHAIAVLPRLLLLTLYLQQPVIPRMRKYSQKAACRSHKTLA